MTRPPAPLPEHLEKALSRGVIDSRQAAEIAAISAEAETMAARRIERFRLFDNFADIFICIGQLVLMSAATPFSALVPGMTPVSAYALFATVNWGMVEYFGRRNRKYAPAALAALLFAYAVARAYALNAGRGGVFLSGAIADDFAVSAILAGALLLAFLRTGLPILLLAIALFGTISLTLVGRDIFPETPMLIISAVSGVACLAIAIRLDMKDPSRGSVVNDHAFWLFVIGSPMTIHSLFVTILLNTGFDIAIWIVFGVALIAATAGIILDRRPLVVSTLAYITIALGYASARFGSWNLTMIALVPIVVGLSIILLGINWHRIRATLLRPLAGSPLLEKLPPTV